MTRPVGRPSKAVPGPVLATEFGKKPTFSWVPKDKLIIDHRYQREVSSKRGLKLIARLQANFRWAHCQALVVTPNGDGTYCVLDGQHRLEAAKGLRMVAQMPCLVVDELDLRDQAKAFVALNEDRVAISKLQIFHAMCAAGDRRSRLLLDACKECGVEILKTPRIPSLMKPNQTMAIGTMFQLYDGNFGRPGPRLLETTLSCLREAYPETRGQITAMMLRAVREALFECQRLLDRPETRYVIEALRGTNDGQLDGLAREARRLDQNVRIGNAYCRVFLDRVSALLPERKAGRNIFKGQAA